MNNIYFYISDDNYSLNLVKKFNEFISKKLNKEFKIIPDTYYNYNLQINNISIVNKYDFDYTFVDISLFCNKNLEQGFSNLESNKINVVESRLFIDLMFKYNDNVYTKFIFKVEENIEKIDEYFNKKLVAGKIYTYNIITKEFIDHINYLDYITINKENSNKILFILDYLYSESQYNTDNTFLIENNELKIS